MQKIIKRYSSLSHELKQLFHSHYPDGFEGEPLFYFYDHTGKRIGALELKTDEFLYLVRPDEVIVEPPKNKRGKEFEEVELEIEVGETEVGETEEEEEKKEEEEEDLGPEEDEEDDEEDDLDNTEDEADESKSSYEMDEDF